MEILYYKARGNRPLIGGNNVSFANFNSSPSVATPATPPTTTQVTPSASPVAVTVAPIPPVDNPQPSSCPAITQPLTGVQRRYAEAAWAYFIANYQSNTGLVSDRKDVKGATVWGLGNYLAALHAARTLDVISAKEFDQRTRQLLGALTQMPLFMGELPHRGYDTRTLQAIDYGGNPTPEGSGWSALDVGRILATLHNLKTCHPEYTTAVDQIVLDWSYLRLVNNGTLASATVIKDKHGRSLPRVNPETRLGYEEYAARAFQLWGFDVNRAAVGGEYKTAKVEGVAVPIQRVRTDSNSQTNQYTVSNPFLLYGLEFGLDPQMRSLFTNIFQAQTERYRRTKTLTAAGTTLIEQQPYTVHSTITGQNQPWLALGDDSKPFAEGRLVSTVVAFAYHAMLPGDNYAQE